jgi:hypothetical protein
MHPFFIYMLNQEGSKKKEDPLCEEIAQKGWFA